MVVVDDLLMVSSVYCKAVIPMVLNSPCQAIQEGISLIYQRERFSYHIIQEHMRKKFKWLQDEKQIPFELIDHILLYLI
jgi:hypothetical protein